MRHDAGMGDERAERLVGAARRLARRAGALELGGFVEYVYNPIAYASRPHEAYLRRWGAGRREVVFQGMNPGPWGMAQTGVPFGDVETVRDWMGIEERVGRPPRLHPRRPVHGFDVQRREASGRRLWGLMKRRFGPARRFFARHFVSNYCPLVLYDAGGRNITPDRLRAGDRRRLFEVCDEHLRAVIDALEPRWVVGVGRFSEGRIRAVAGEDDGWRPAYILHPSPASPLANRNWAEDTVERLEELGIW
jgi:single-strand selective monofunctional uracil DNA glycosylase